MANLRTNDDAGAVLPHQIHLFLPSAHQLPMRRNFVLAMMRIFRSFEMSHPAVKITVERPAKRLTYEENIKPQGSDMGQDMGLEEFLVVLESGN